MGQYRKSSYILLVLVVFLSLFWLVFYSFHVANNEFIISLRNTYFTQLDKITPERWFIYRVRPIKTDENGSYIYKFPGKFQKFDFENSVIVLKDLHGKNWAFRYFTNKMEDGTKSDFSESIDYRYSLKKKDGSFVNTLSKILVNKTNPSISFSPFSKNDLIVLYWRDDKTMSDLYNFSKKGGIIELNGAKLIQINKIVWE